MFDIGWSELLVIAVVAIIVVGPKDLPGMLRAFGRTMTQVRRTANDFKRQFNEALREAVGENRETSSSANDATLIDLAQRLSPVGRAQSHEDAGQAS